MADNEGIRDSSARLLATATMATGIGVALYKGFKESPGSFHRLAETTNRSFVPKMMSSSIQKDQSRYLMEAFSAIEDVMSPLGSQEILRRSYHQALYKRGVVKDDFRDLLVEKLVQSSTTWNKAEVAIKQYEHELGGIEGLYNAMREISGGTIRGNRSKDLAEIIRNLPNIGPDEFGRRGGYLRSAFEEGGQFWKDRFSLKSKMVEPATFSIKKSKFLEKKIGVPIDSGYRISNRPRLFKKDEGLLFEFKLGKNSQVSLPFQELRVGGSGSRVYLQIPKAVEHEGINLVAADHRGMSFSSVPHFAVPLPGGKYEKVSWNRGIHMMLYGDKDKGIEGLAQNLHRFHGDRKAQENLIRSWNMMIRGLFHRVDSSQSNMTQALMHSESIVPLDMHLAKILGEKVDTSIEGLTTFYKSMKDSGFDVGPLASPDPMAEHYRISLKDWSKRWDIFGEGYPIERRYSSRIKSFTMTEDAIKTMASMPIGGVLPRGYGITATAIARTEMQQMPQVVGYLSLEEAKHFRPEEAVLSRKLAPIMRMKSTQKFEVLEGTTQAVIGETLQKGVVVGVDYRTGESILAENIPGRVEQKIIDARQHGNIVRLEVESQLPLQDQMKIFGYKAQVHKARGNISAELVHEWKADKAGLRFSKDIEFIGSASLMKNIPQEINKQMAEASWLIMQKRLEEAGVLRSGGKSKVSRQRRRSSQKKKTYTYKGGLPKDHVDMSMLMYVRDQSYRSKVLANRKKASIRLAKRLGITKNQEPLALGLELLRYAKKRGFNEEEISLIGGVFYRQLESATGNSDEAIKLLKQVGLTSQDIVALKEAKGVLAMPTMHVGGYASFTDKWGRAGMDYRALGEIKAQQWGKAGDMLINEIARRVIPTEDLSELHRAVLSMIGRSNELPEGIERIRQIREANEALGKKEFIFDYGGREVYVPGPKVKGMQKIPIEVGELMEKDLASTYRKYIFAQSAASQYPDEQRNKLLTEATEDLQKELHKEWAAAGSLRGKVYGTTGPVARTWISSDPRQTIAHQFASTTEFIEDKNRVFTIGTSKETGTKMFRDLISRASPEEKAFLEAQELAFLSGSKVTGFVWRHPTHRPQSLMPAWFKLVGGEGESAHFQNLTMKHSDRILDVSYAQGMKLDTDFDHVQLGLIGDEKVKIAVDDLMNSRRYREDFLNGLAIQSDLMERIKNTAAPAGVTSKAAEGYAAGLQRLIGVKMETGTISNLVGEMRAAAAFQASGKEYKIASYLLAELEEGPISSKHGLHVGEIKEHLQTFVKGKGAGVREAMQEAWQKIFEESDFTAGDIKFSRDEFISKMGSWISASEESGQLAAWKNIARRGAQAQKGKEMTTLTTDMLSKIVTQFESGIGDPNATLIREMRMGPGSAISASRQVTGGLKEVASTAMSALKKHWRYPLVGGALAFAITGLSRSNERSMPDHNQQVTQLGQGPGIPDIAAPVMHPNRIVTAGGGITPVGYGVHSERDFSAQGIRQIGAYGYETGSSVRISDNRGAITPEYIQKAQRERYY